MLICFISVAASYKIPKEETGVPFLIIGDQVLVGSDQVRESIACSGGGLFDSRRCGLPRESDSRRPSADDFPASPSTSDLPAATQAVPSPETESTPPVEEVRK